jgi:hypothetical protein
MARDVFCLRSAEGTSGFHRQCPVVPHRATDRRRSRLIPHMQTAQRGEATRRLGRQSIVWVAPRDLARHASSCNAAQARKACAMVHLDPLARLLRRGCEHLHALGSRATAAFLVEIGHRIGGTEGDQFPPRLVSPT